MDLIKEIQSYLAIEIKQMNSLILSCLAAEEELINLVGNHIAQSGGKRLRPILTLLSAKMFNHNSESIIKLATAVEFIHMATLLHDDVVDGSKMRRFLPSANVLWGSKASILVGDFLFSQSFKLIIGSRSIDSMVVLSDASAIIAEGEVSQLAKLEQHRLINEEEYLQIINAKTAELFGSACEVGAIVAGQPKSFATSLRNFGMKLGSIFQITDDLLDYFSDSKDTGKNIGDDFAEGKVTLPIIFLSKKLNEAQNNKLTTLISADNRTSEDFAWVKNLLAKFDIKSEISDYLQEMKMAANKYLDEIDVENQSKKYLTQLIDFAVERSY